MAVLPRGGSLVGVPWRRCCWVSASPPGWWPEVLFLLDHHFLTETTDSENIAEERS